MTHERCSELLGPYERGELAADAAREVEDHLATCEGCREELAGIRALLATEYEPLRDDERSTLRSAVAEQVRAGRTTVTMFPARRTFWERHAGQIVGAAASLVVILFAVLVAQGIFDGGDDGGAGGQGSALQGGGGDAAQPAAEGPAPVFAGADTGPRTAAAEEDAAEGAAGRNLSRALLQSRAAYTENSLEKLGANGPIFRRFARGYDSSAAAAAPEFLEQLVAAAPDDLIGDQVRECGTSILPVDPSRPLLPAFAASADFEGEPALIIGFVTAADADGPLDQFSIWAWSEGSCDIPLTGLQGPIKGAG